MLFMKVSLTETRALRAPWRRARTSPARTAGGSIATRVECVGVNMLEAQPLAREHQRGGFDHGGCAAYIRPETLKARPVLLDRLGNQSPAKCRALLAASRHHDMHLQIVVPASQL